MKNPDKLIQITQTETVTKEEFCFYIRNVRESLGYSVQELSKKIGYPPATITKYEQGQRVPRDPYSYIEKLRELIKIKRTE